MNTSASASAAAAETGWAVVVGSGLRVRWAVWVVDSVMGWVRVRWCLRSRAREWREERRGWVSRVMVVVLVVEGAVVVEVVGTGAG